ncbi:conserved domain protein [Teredinibacter turnerae T7901]|uniref:Conserved domain protein n=1 Tax=Teredinibacter turnerae (strain ATCC 39867 / T7901) TaxID=377629 RepID=C5BMY2_TERTT|nr:flavin reductase family protein [Teredinibacter turnerae]ACR13074.1 conserved domain protein [Teredinibacter turnerae T7901]
MHLNFSELSPLQRYLTIVQTVTPRPIAWILSDSGEGRFNLAPYSFFTAICADPPLLLVSVGKKLAGKEAGQVKDTSINIRERKEFVVHIASTAQAEALNQSAATLDHAISEVDTLGLATAELPGFRLPRIADCSVAFGCTLYRLDEVGNAPQSVIYGEITHAYIAPDVISNADTVPPGIDPQKLDPLAKLGGPLYTGLGDILNLPRPE